MLSCVTHLAHNQDRHRSKGTLRSPSRSDDRSCHRERGERAAWSRGKPSGDLSSRSRPPIGARYASGTVVEPPPSGLVELGVPAHVLT
jgi:hypothetical protein